MDSAETHNGSSSTTTKDDLRELRRTYERFVIQLQSLERNLRYRKPFLVALKSRLVNLKMELADIRDRMQNPEDY